MKVEYLIDFYDYNKNLFIIPSDLSLINKLHILCISKEIKRHNYIISLANIVNNRHFKCIEFFKSDEDLIFGIKIYKIENNIEYKNINFFSYRKELNYNFISDINYTFDCSQIKEDFKELAKSILKKKNKKNNNFKLKESYIQNPLCIPKNKFQIKRKKWIFANIYNFYFCFCKGPPCFYQNIPQKCKYYFYLNIIDNNKDIYKKTDYLFGDFIFNQYSSDDTYPIFEKMINQNLPAHYLTQNMNIYLKYCFLNQKCLKIIRFCKNDEIINGDFLEKYLDIILKLKVVATGAEFTSFDNIFYNIDYISYISVGHGVSFFKHFLYGNDSYYGYKKYNKILIPPSEKLILIAKHYGWNDEDIIKINLPRWDKYNKYTDVKNKSIFIMFTWRELAENKKLSNDYINNILNLINNKLLIKELKKNNIKLYFTFHHQLSKYNSLSYIDKFITIINENQISKIISVSNLYVTDFSSILFDFIYRKKPFVIYIPDSNYNKNKNIYTDNYSKLIKDLKENKIPFENKYFNIEEAINKIISYVNNNFEIEQKLKNFYDSFSFKRKNNIKEFIEYIKNIA